MPGMKTGRTTREVARGHQARGGGGAEAHRDRREHGCTQAKAIVHLNPLLVTVRVRPHPSAFPDGEQNTEAGMRA
jgi:hypothetical protein